MIGAIFGDIVGSVYEFRNHKSKNFRLFKLKTNRYTDDSIMTLAVAKALLDFDKEKGIPHFRETLIDTMHRIGMEYPSVGYGRGFNRWLKTKCREPYNSLGNGSAMRVSPVAWYAKTLEETLLLAEASADVTHNHPEGIKGAQATAGAIFLARQGASKEEIAEFFAQYYTIDFTLDEIRPTYRFDVTCMGTVPPAMQAFLEATDFEDAIRNAISVGGDSDTLAAITGSIAEAFFGMTAEQTEKALSYLDPSLRQIADDFINMVGR